MLRKVYELLNQPVDRHHVCASYSWAAQPEPLYLTSQHMHDHHWLLQWSVGSTPFEALTAKCIRPMHLPPTFKDIHSKKLWIARLKGDDGEKYCPLSLSTKLLTTLVLSSKIYRHVWFLHVLISVTALSIQWSSMPCMVLDSVQPAW